MARNNWAPGPAARMDASAPPANSSFWRRYGWTPALGHRGQVGARLRSSSSASASRRVSRRKRCLAPDRRLGGCTRLGGAATVQPTVVVAVQRMHLLLDGGFGDGREHPSRKRWLGCSAPWLVGLQLGIVRIFIVSYGTRDHCVVQRPVAIRLVPPNDHPGSRLQHRYNQPYPLNQHDWPGSPRMRAFRVDREFGLYKEVRCRALPGFACPKNPPVPGLSRYRARGPTPLGATLVLRRKRTDRVDAHAVVVADGAGRLCQPRRPASLMATEESRSKGTPGAMGRSSGAGARVSDGEGVTSDTHDIAGKNTPV